MDCSCTVRCAQMFILVQSKCKCSIVFYAISSWSFFSSFWTEERSKQSIDAWPAILSSAVQSTQQTIYLSFRYRCTMINLNFIHSRDWLSALNDYLKRFIQSKERKKHDGRSNDHLLDFDFCPFTNYVPLSFRLMIDFSHLFLPSTNDSTSITSTLCRLMFEHHWIICLAH